MTPSLGEYSSDLTVPKLPDAGPNSPYVKLLRSVLLGRLADQNVGPEAAEIKHWYVAVAKTIRDILQTTWEESKSTWNEPNGKRAHYLSMEYLPGPHTYTALNSAQLGDAMPAALSSLVPKKLGLTPQDIYSYEPDPGLGNGGLGRLASCFMDSAASLHLPLLGYGLFYRNGFFRQHINDAGRQEELPDVWRIDGQNPWGIIRDDRTHNIKFFGNHNSSGNGKDRWENATTVSSIAHDGMIPSFDGQQINTLRLWNVNGDVRGDDERSKLIRQINDKLYPPNDDEYGKKLRLMQEYFFTSSSLQDILDCHINRHQKPLRDLPDSVAIQLNDTHPVIAIPEMIRLLVDEHGMDIKNAKAIARATTFYTNHTLASEALERVSVGNFQEILPRHLAIIEDLQTDLMAEVETKGKAKGWSQQDIWDRQSRVSIIHGNEVHMARLAAFFTSQTNGVAKMHSDLLAESLFSDLPILRGEAAITNHTNGISPRSWLVEANPPLATLITEKLGDNAWVTNLPRLDSETGIRPFLHDPDFRQRFHDIKQSNKSALVALISKQGGPALDPHAFVDVQVKRFHQYKRQFLNILHTVALYQDILENPDKVRPNTIKIFAGKAAPSYGEAKDNIALIHALARRINSDPRVADKLKVAFIENYSVSTAKKIIPAADLSEQISTAGWEASGTSNMKLALNGALTIGTRDGANVEIGQRTGEDNIFFFGHSKQQLDDLDRRGYNPLEFIERSPRLYKALVFLQKETPPGTPFAQMTESIWRGDQPWKIAADWAGNPEMGVRGYWDTKEEAARLYVEQPQVWLTKSIVNTLAGSHFSSDDTIREYAQTWGIVPLGEIAPPKRPLVANDPAPKQTPRPDSAVA